VPHDSSATRQRRPATAHSPLARIGLPGARRVGRALRHPRPIQAAVLLSSAVLLAAPAAGLFSTLAESSIPKPNDGKEVPTGDHWFNSKNGTSVNVVPEWSLWRDRQDVLSNPQQVMYDKNAAVISVQVTELDHASGHVNVHLKISIPPEVADRLYIVRRPESREGLQDVRPIVHRTKEFIPGDYIKRRSLETASANIDCRIVVGQASQSVTLARLLDQVTTGTGTRAYETNLTVPVNSSRQLYPRDWYRANLPINVDLPDTLRFRLNPRHYYGYFPANIYINRSDNLQDVRVKSATFLESPNRLDIVFTRPWSRQLYIFVMALAPVLLVVIIAHLAFTRRSTAFEFPLEVTAALVALLPLRSVLVPSDLPGLTVIDYILGIEVMALIGLVAISYTRTFTRKDPGASTGPAPTTVPAVPDSNPNQSSNDSREPTATEVARSQNANTGRTASS
jgi:hypothetical protein